MASEPSRPTSVSTVERRQQSASETARLVSVVIPARNEVGTIADAISAVLAQEVAGVRLEVVMVDDGSTDGTVEAAEAAGARVLRLGTEGEGGSPAAARNRGAEQTGGDPIIFLDADCTPLEGWLEAILQAHDGGAAVVGGALDMPPGLSPTARCDYYCGWYLIHSGCPAGDVPHHPPPCLSVRREAFFSTSRFSEDPPLVYTNEERAWQGELLRRGERIYFQPRAVAYHYNRSGFLNLLKRNYRWAYTALEAKGPSGSARYSWLYRHPRLLIVGSLPLAGAQSLYILGCWLKAGVWEPLWMFPGILVSRVAYAAGMSVGGIRWLRRGRSGPAAKGPRWV